MGIYKSCKNIFIGAIATTFIITTVSPTFAAENQNIKFNDEAHFDSSHKENIYKAVELGLVKGENGNFHPVTPISRGQVVKTLARYLENVHGKIDTSIVIPFEDVGADSSDPELYRASLIVKKFGTFEGYNGKLLPKENITRQAMAKVLVKAFNLNEQEKVGESRITDLDLAQEWAREYIQTLSELDITNVKDFRPLINVSREQYASFLVRSVEMMNSTTEDSSGDQ
ncbi:hypothetical protein J2S13_001683 [Oikeobacillus pervagus]|uniref:SLH domain-containing protein n=1 Tax=Oikeobacillus pervagus TaxID=1325931 RepID=A0AAJ1WJB4_9BACI|nr:S-layer homology domain-containing protein [Oikeobacillus pervagus]MDQ0215283.1 hypothetical protein [Oikeobacillus pervagus]